MSENVKPILANLAAWGSAAITWSRVDEITKVLATCAAIAVSIVTVRYMISKRELTELQRKRELCKQCKEGHAPPECPYPEEERPSNCPHMDEPGYE